MKGPSVPAFDIAAMRRQSSFVLSSCATASSDSMSWSQRSTTFVQRGWPLDGYGVRAIPVPGIEASPVPADVEDTRESACGMEIGDLVIYLGQTYVLRGLDPMSVPDRQAVL